MRWQTELPGRGVSSPVIVGGRVYITASSGARDDRFHVLCFDTASGKQLWERRFFATGNTICHPKTCMAAPTPVASANRVFVLFASCDLFCLDKDGVLVWCRSLGQDYPDITNHIGMASSPVLVGDILIVPIETPGESFAAGIDTATGRNRWKIDRTKENTWTTPFVWQRAAGAEVLLQSSDRLSSHDPKTGKQLWSLTGTELAKIASPVAGSNLALTTTREELLAVEPPVQAGGAARIVWRSTKLKPPTATPLIHADKVYTITSVGLLCCADVATGEIAWRERVPGRYSASPVLAGDRLYLVNEDGVTTVVQLGIEPRVLATNKLNEIVLGTPALADDALFVRSDKHLFCISTKKGTANPR
ncbi:MAG: PQQ-binding-like beta-propeller repeat protein [Gemmataceae bacterium]